MCTHTNDQTALKNLDATGGKAINAGSYYIQYDVTENDTVTYKLFQRYSAGALEVTGNINSDTPLTGGNTFTIQASSANSTTLSTAVSVTLWHNNASLASDINAANVASVASVDSSGYLVIKHSLGGVIVLKIHQNI